MNKKNLFIYALIFVLMFSLTSFASNYSENVIRYYNNIKIKLNGQELIPKDENGSIVEPFVINGTTYLPVRAIGNALGLDVNWDSLNNTILLNSTVNVQKVTIANVSKKEINDLQINIGQVIDLIAIVYPINSNSNIKWESTNPNIATIDMSGRVTPLSEGYTLIRAIDENGAADSCKLTVNLSTTKNSVSDLNNTIIYNPVTGEISTKYKTQVETVEDIEKSENITSTSQTINNSTSNTQSNTTSHILSSTEQKNVERYKSYVTGMIYEKMNARGLLDSSMTTQMINRALEDVNSNIIVYITTYGEKYHTSSCQYLYNSSTAIRKGKAIKTGYLPCSRCNP